MSATRRAWPHRDVVGAAAIWILSLQGLLLSGVLTTLKFRADTLCDQDGLGTCPLGAASSCVTVLGDAWSTVLGLPLTVFSAAFYLVTLVLAALTVAGRDTRTWTRPVLLALAWAGLLVALALAVYAGAVLRVLCPYCLFLDLVHLGIWLAARLMNPWGLRGALARARADRRTLVVAALAVLGLVTAVSVQRAALRHIARERNRGDLSACEIGLTQVPTSALTVASADPPRLVAAVFLDLGCVHCRDEFESWLRFQPGAMWPIELRFFHFPATSCDREALASGAPDLSRNRSCDAARALHCMLRLGDRERAVDMTRALFALQDGDEPHFSAGHLAAVARDFGVAADPDRPAAADPLFACMTDPATGEALARDVELAEVVAELDRPPGALLIPLRNGRPLGRARQVRGRRPQATLEAWIDALLAQPGPPT